MQSHEDAIRHRLMLAAIGAFAGFFFWFLFEHLPDLVGDERMQMLIGAFAAILFGGLMLMVGPVRPVRALGYAGGLAAVSAALLLWTSYRFSGLNTFLDSIHPAIAYSLLVWLPLPFAMAQETAPGGWRDYEGLFDHAWSNFVRLIAAWMFDGLFWGVLFLSDELLKLVGFPFLGDLVENTWISMPLSGLVMGLAMAVLNELDGVVSTLRGLALRLFRLLLPPVAVVILLFIILLPVQGLGKVFGSFSAAGTMLVMALGAITLITSAVDARETDAIVSRLMTVPARALSLLLPVITAIAVYAIWVRVAQYGWTPQRLSAGVASVMLFTYSLAYGLSAIRSEGWRARIRSVNTAMAVAVIGVSLVWLTPVLNVERISSNSHLARFKAGKIGVEDLDLWSLGHDWGNPGRAALADVRAISGHKQQAALVARLAQYDTAGSRWDFESNKSAKPTNQPRRIEALAAILPLKPTTATVPDGMLDALPSDVLSLILAGCEKQLDDGRPACAAVLGSFDPAGHGEDLVLFWRSFDGISTRIALIQSNAKTGEFDYRPAPVFLGERPQDQGALIAMVLDGRFTFGPAQINVLEIDGAVILPSR